MTRDNIKSKIAAIVYIQHFSLNLTEIQLTNALDLGKVL